MNIAYMALYGEGTDLLGYVLLQNMQLARATLDVELEHMGSPDKLGGKILNFPEKVIPLCHE